MVAIAITSNASFKQEYARCLRYSFFAAVAIHLLLFYYCPQFDFKPLVIPEVPVTTFVPSPKYKIPPKPEPVKDPVVNIIPAENGEEETDADIRPNVYRDFDEFLEPSTDTEEKAKEFYPFDEAPELIKSVTPVYPELMRQAGIEGMVNLLVLVGDDGTVLRVSVLRSDVTPVMERAAMAAVKKFLFRPAKQGSFSVKARMMVPIVFSLH